MELETKKWWSSRGLWGSLVAMVAGAAGFVGYSIAPEDQLALIDGALKAGALVTDAAALIGGTIALWGRVVATKRIG